MSPVVPITHGTPAESVATALPCTAAGAVKSTAASKPAASTGSPTSTPTTSCPAAASALHQDGADLALAAEEEDSHAARATASGLNRLTAARKRFSLGPMPAAESRSGA